MTWLALSVLLIQARWISSCVFDKVEKVPGDFLKKITNLTESECFAVCYENKECSAIAYTKSAGLCYLYRAAKHSLSCKEYNVCYTLLRDEVDSACQRYVPV